MATTTDPADRNVSKASAKIENDEKKAPASDKTYEVLVSFDGLDKGDRFTADDDQWAKTHVETGYLRDVTGQPVTYRPTAEQMESLNAGDVSQG